MQPNGSQQSKIGQARYPAPTAWQNNAYSNAANRHERPLEQNRNAVTTSRNRQTDSIQWRSHQQSNFRVRNLAVGGSSNMK